MTDMLDDRNDDGTEYEATTEGSWLAGKGSGPMVPVDIEAIVQAYADARYNREEVSDKEKQLRSIESAAESGLFEALERLGLRSVRHKNLGLFTLNDMASGVVTDETKLREWANEVMPELMLPNRARLGKVIRDALKGEGEMPPGTDVTFARKINWRRG